jgi:HlyD family secretion protein
MVDYARPESVVRKKKYKRIAYSVAGLLAIVAVTLGVSRLRPAAPSVERGTLLIDTVKRGPMVRNVRGTGTLVPEDIRWIPATTAGRVEKIVLRSGATVTADSIIVELSNPDLQQSVIEAKLQLDSAEAQLINRRAELEKELLTQRSATAEIGSNFRQAELKAQADESLFKDRLLDELTTKIDRAKADDLKNRFAIEQQRLDMSEKTIKSQLAVQEAEVNRLRTVFQLRKEQLEKLHVRAGLNGILQTVPVEVGAQLQAGANIARVADPSRLKAELRVPETQAKDVEPRQVAEVDTRNGFVKGKVCRIDAAAVNGTVTVDVCLEGELPRGARPDLTVDGTVVLENLPDVIQVGRPAFGQDAATISLFKVDPTTGEAQRTQVQLGRSSVTSVEILKGLKPGDQVILTDMSAWDAYDRVRVN